MAGAPVPNAGCSAARGRVGKLICRKVSRPCEIAVLLCVQEFTCGHEFVLTQPRPNICSYAACAPP